MVQIAKRLGVDRNRIRLDIFEELEYVDIKSFLELSWHGLVRKFRITTEFRNGWLNKPSWIEWRKKNCDPEIEIMRFHMKYDQYF